MSHGVIQQPPGWMRLRRTGLDGVERIAFIGYVERTIDRGDGTSQVELRAPEGLLRNWPLPFVPPMIERATLPRAFEFWWRQLDYVFRLPDPRTFPPLTAQLATEDRQLVDRYVGVAGELAESLVLNASEEGFSVRQPDLSAPESIVERFTHKEIHRGFGVALRQCNTPNANEPARFARVLTVLRGAADIEVDSSRAERLDQLQQWQDAMARLHKKSLNQLVRDRLATEEGVWTLRYDEEASPEKLVSLFNYGDLIHWGAGKREIVAAWQRDPFVASDRWLAFIDAATVLAHLHIGFGELARAAVA